MRDSWSESLLDIITRYPHDSEKTRHDITWWWREVESATLQTQMTLCQEDTSSVSTTDSFSLEISIDIMYVKRNRQVMWGIPFLSFSSLLILFPPSLQLFFNSSSTLLPSSSSSWSWYWSLAGASLDSLTTKKKPRKKALLLLPQKRHPSSRVVFVDSRIIMNAKDRERKESKKSKNSLWGRLKDTK